MNARGQTVTVLGLQMCARVPGGTGRYTAELLHALADSTPRWARPQVYGYRRCHVQTPPQWPTVSTWLSPALLGGLWDRGLGPAPHVAGIVHAPTLMVPPRRTRYRLLVTVHDTVPWTHPQTLTARGVAFHRRMGARAAREADLIVTPTQAVADQVREVLSPRCDIVAVPSGVAVGAVPRDADLLREQAGAGTGYVLFVGTAEPRKGLDVLVAAMARPPLVDRRLVVVGPPGWGDVRVDDVARRAGCAGRVRVTGAVDEPTLAALYAGAAVLALPSRAEGFGFPVLEAMAHGIPVVTSDDPALVEVGGGVARVVPGGDVEGLAHALAELSADGPEQDALIRAGRARAAEFSWSATATRMWELYRAQARG